MRIYIDCCERSQVQRIVITSSTAAIVSLPLSKSTVFSEQDWNLSDIKQVQEMGAYGVYCTAKTLAEKGGVFFLSCLSVSPLTMFLANQLPGIFMSSTSHRLNGI